MTRLKLFLYSLYISSTTVGGGFVIITVVRRIFVEKLALLTEDEMNDIVSLAQSSPGAVAINLSIALGYRFCGITGALLAVLGTAIPPMVIMSLIAALYIFFEDIRDSVYIIKIMRGMQLGVAAVVLNAAISMTTYALNGKNFIKYAVFALSFVMYIFFKINSIYIVLSSVIIGIISSAVKFMKTISKK